MSFDDVSSFSLATLAAESFGHLGESGDAGRKSGIEKGFSHVSFPTCAFLRDFSANAVPRAAVLMSMKSVTQ